MNREVTRWLMLVVAAALLMLVALQSDGLLHVVDRLLEVHVPRLDRS